MYSVYYSYSLVRFLMIQIYDMTATITCNDEQEITALIRLIDSSTTKVESNIQQTLCKIYPDRP